MTKRIRIGDMLVQSNMLTAEKLEQALALQKELGKRLGEILVEQGFVTENQLTQTLSNQLSVPWVSLYHVDFTRALLNYVPRELAERFCLVPVYVRAVRRSGDTLFIAMDDPTNEEAIAAVATVAALPVKPMVAAPSDIRNAIRVYYGGGKSIAPHAEVGYAAPPAPRAKPVSAPAPKPVSAPAPAPVSAAAPVPVAVAVAVPEPAPVPVPEPVSAPVPESVPATLPEPAAVVAPAAEPAKPQKRKGPRMISITLLDGTSISLPAPGQKKVVESAVEPVAESEEHALTAADLVAALRAKAAGADVSDVLGNATWESMFAALLSVLMKKHLVADWEFVDEWKKHRGS
jgi:type IV pilus assembly protein PilB